MLEIYRLPHDPLYPVICMDEANKQLIGEVRVPLPANNGQPVRIDYEYERLGVCNQILFVEPLAGWRKVFVTEQRTAVDWALCVREVLDVNYPHARKVRLVLDNLNIHTGASLYQAFAPTEARWDAGLHRECALFGAGQVDHRVVGHGPRSRPI